MALPSGHSAGEYEDASLTTTAPSMRRASWRTMFHLNAWPPAAIPRSCRANPGACHCSITRPLERELR